MNNFNRSDDSGFAGPEEKRPNTLKSRIKRAMATDECPKRNSVLTAATALASLGSESSGHPTGQGNGNTKEQMPAFRPSVARSNADDVGQAAHSMPSRMDHDVPMTFPQKLMEVLSNHEISDIITWLPHGKGFIILQKRKFASDVMPLYFKHSKFTSFTRKLNRWGFTRITRGPETGAYYHKFFQRNNHLLCMQMHCQSSKTSCGEASPGVSPQMASPNVMNALSTLRLDERIPSPPFSRPSEDGSRFPGNNPYSSSAPAAANSRDMSLIQRAAAQGNVVHSRSALERVLFRQRELLREEQRVRMMQEQNHANNPNDFGMRNQRGPMDSMQQNRLNVSPSFGVNTSSSRQHPFVIQAALNALKSCNDRAYLTMLMTREHNKNDSKGRENAPISSTEIQNRVHAAMQAQMRQLEEYNRRTMNCKIGGAQVVSQNEVAQLHKEISQKNGSSSNASNRRHNVSPSSRYPPGVRRASAA